MPFPDTWMQAWIWLEYASNDIATPPGTYFTSSLYWYRLQSGAVPTTSTEQDDLANNTATLLWQGYQVYTPNLFNSSVHVYVQSPSAAFSRIVDFGPGLNNYTNYLPSSSSAVARRFTDVLTPRGIGRVYLPGVPSNSVDGRHMTPTGLILLQTAADQILVDTFSTGSLWQHALASYTTSSFNKINRMLISTELGTVRKRVRPHLFRNPQWAGPKPAPL